MTSCESSPPATTTSPLSGTATTRDNATGSRTESVVAVTARRTAENVGGALEAGANSADPVTGARDEAGTWIGACEAGGEAFVAVSEDAAPVLGDCRARGEVQLATETSATTAEIVIEMPPVIRGWLRRVDRIADVTNSLWAPHMTTA